MDHLLKALSIIQVSSTGRNIVDAARNYICSGDSEWLAGVRRPVSGWYIWSWLTQALPDFSAMTEYDYRALRVMINIEPRNAAHWIDERIRRERSDEDVFGAVCDELMALHTPEGAILQIIAENMHEYQRHSGPTSLGRFVTSLPDHKLSFIIQHAPPRICIELSNLLVRYSPGLLNEVLDDLFKPQNEGGLHEISEDLLSVGGEVYEPRVVRAFKEAKSPYYKFTIGCVLAEYNQSRYLLTAIESARSALLSGLNNTDFADIAVWLMESRGTESIPDILAFIKTNPVCAACCGQKILSQSTSRFGKGASEILLTAMQLPDTETEALSYLIQIDDGAYHDLIKEKIEQGFKSTDINALIVYVGLASQWDVNALREQLWKLFGHKSKPVRQAVVKALAKLTNEVVEKCSHLLSETKSDTRLTAVQLLSAVNTPEALEVLEKHLDDEDSDDVREAVLKSVQDSWLASGRQFEKKDVESMAMRYSAKLKWPPASWVDASILPSLRYTDGTPVPSEILHYLLARQSKTTEIRASTELKPLYSMIDPASGGDLAIMLFQEYIRFGANAKDKWVLATAGLLGDDRLVPIISSQIKDWVEGNRGKLAEYAVQALALIATDKALLAIDNLSMRYRTKMKNVGAAAVESFASAADSLGITVEELGDRVVPWMGFDSSGTRIVEIGDKKISIRVGADFKLQYVDASTGKRIASLPSGTPKEVKDDIKELGATLREVSKAQTLRLENLMVKRHQWPVERWKELFMAHPLLSPFGIRVVWGYYENDELQHTFRALEDGSLTDASDDNVDMADNVKVGIVHPLELSLDDRQAWMNHLSDYEINPPFLQMERPVVLVTDEQNDTKFYKDLSGMEINGMTFKGRAERLGWRRGSVCDAGSITTYLKSFPSAGIDAFVVLEDMYVGIDMYSDIKLGEAFFTRHKTVTIGSYEYDEPKDEKDPRLVPFGQVPPIVYSEVMGDLKRIAGQKETI